MGAANTDAVGLLTLLFLSVDHKQALVSIVFSS